MTLNDSIVVSLLVLSMMLLGGAIEPWATEWRKHRHPLALMLGVLPAALALAIILIRLISTLADPAQSTIVDIVVYLFVLLLAAILFVVPRTDLALEEDEKEKRK